MELLHLLPVAVRGWREGLGSVLWHRLLGGAVVPGLLLSQVDLMLLLGHRVEESLASAACSEKVPRLWGDRRGDAARLGLFDAAVDEPTVDFSARIQLLDILPVTRGVCERCRVASFHLFLLVSLHQGRELGHIVLCHEFWLRGPIPRTRGASLRLGNSREEA